MEEKEEVRKRGKVAGGGRFSVLGDYILGGLSRFLSMRAGRVYS